MSPEQHKRFLEFIQSRWKPPFECRCCGSNNWDVELEIYQIMKFSQEGLILGGTRVPLAPVTCSNCGNTILINALIAGIVEQPKAEQQKEGNLDAK